MSALFLILVLRVDLSSFDRSLQMIFLRWEGAGGIVCKRTGRTVGFVEINKYFAIFVRIRVVVATRGIRLVVVGQVHELNEKTAIG